MSDVQERDFVFDDKDFEEIRVFVKQHTGISLSDAKRNMVYGRLSRRLRHLNIKSFADYMDLVKQPGSPEVGDFINAMTTNLTSFFRENHHFEYVRKTVIPEVMKANMATRKIRIWSAGCSTGEEPYSLAMTLASSIPSIDTWDVKILATDLDTNVLAHAERGVYDIDRVESVPDEYRRRWLMKGKGSNSGSVCMSRKIKDMITFRKLNLMMDWPMRGPFDFIFCRNVVIYFDKETQKKLFDRYADILIPHGHVFLGHSESLFKVSTRFELVGNTIYRKKD
ncbi:MAG: protein-glutamate O-methyltransferase CheR [Gammaproteobacteria bacterium]|nr:protein-glutamate O-methyltransferase CheR [Gammaproteobacteria bacterium]